MNHDTEKLIADRLASFPANEIATVCRRGFTQDCCEAIARHVTAALASRGAPAEPSVEADAIARVAKWLRDWMGATVPELAEPTEWDALDAGTQQSYYKAAEAAIRAYRGESEK